ncbi:MAG TPA: hypothetical protein VLG38_01275 [Gammaproteobacteria bacterium]|nr:hypothetical protein [Gammaproteobacteria bacterium]
MMMTQTFIATIAFAIGLLAFCSGAWMTIWATSNRDVSDVAAAKLTGYFITVLALIALVFTSYYIAMGVLSSQVSTGGGRWTSNLKHQGTMKGHSKNVSSHR